MLSTIKTSFSKNPPKTKKTPRPPFLENAEGASTACAQLHETRPTLTEILWYQLITAVHDEHTAHVELDVVLFLLVLKEVKRSPTGDEQQCPEFQLTFYREVLKKKIQDEPIVYFKTEVFIPNITSMNSLEQRPSPRTKDKRDALGQLLSKFSSHTLN